MGDVKKFNRSRKTDTPLSVTPPLPTNMEEALVVLKGICAERKREAARSDVTTAMAQSILAKSTGLSQDLVGIAISAQTQQKLIEATALEIVLANCERYNWSEEE